MFKKIIPLFLLILVLFPILLPLFNNGYFSMHDDTQPSRVYEMAASLKDGQFPVRWVNDLGYGYGYPIFNFYAPLPYYFGAVFVILGITVIWATKFMFAFPAFLAGFAMYFLAKKFWGNWGGLLAGILYSYAPYHAVEIYIRGAVGEYWAYAFLPLVFYGIIETKSNYKKGILVGSLSFVGLILSHNILAYITLLFLGLWIFLELGKLILLKKSINYLTSVSMVAVIGLMVSAFFWLPAISEINLTKAQSLTMGSDDFHRHFVYFDQLWDSPWGFAGSGSGREDGMSFKIGKVHLLLGLTSFFYGLNELFRKSGQKLFSKKIFILLAGFLISIFMMLPMSVKLWETLPFMSFVQYPWRLLVFSIFFLSLMIGGLFSFKKIKAANPVIKSTILLTIIILTLFYNLKLFRPQFKTNQNEKKYISPENLNWSISKISDEYLPKDFSVPLSLSALKTGNFEVNGDIIIEQNEFKSHFTKLKISAREPAEIIFFKAYFPGWQTVIDTMRVKPEIKNGFISIQVPEGRHIITLFLEDTWVRKIGNIISSFGLVLISIILLKKVYETKS